VEEGGTLRLNAVQVLALAALGVALGAGLKRKLRLLDRLNIPASIVGGLLYALALLALRDRYLNLEMDLALRDILMVAFFTTIGMSASWQLIRQGGKQVLWFWALASTGALLQNLLGMGLAGVYCEARSEEG
jgi:ESS family glutamate:Na+ symporter